MSSNEIKEKVLELVRKAIEQDEELRKKYGIGDKFRFVRDRLRQLSEAIEAELKTKVVVQDDTKREVMPDQRLVYVYLYNTHGSHFRSWQNMLSPDLFYEYSVNRPIYPDLKSLQRLLKTKENKLQHAFLAVAVSKSDIIETAAQDGLGQPLLKVKEGSLHFDNLISFTHNEQDYVLNSEGLLIKPK